MSSTSTAEAGRVDGDEAVHAVRPGLAGPTASCGAGRIVLRVPGRFGGAEGEVCPRCAELAR